MANILARLLLVGFAVLAAACALAILAYLVNSHFDRRAGEAFHAVRMGAPESEVVAALGTPDVERPCGDNLWWGGDSDYRGKNDGRCVREVRYEYFLSAWAVGYSKDRKVVSKYHYFSE
jgi:hypothetical protein